MVKWLPMERTVLCLWPFWECWGCWALPAGEGKAVMMAGVGGQKVGMKLGGNREEQVGEAAGGSFTNGNGKHWILSSHFSASLPLSSLQICTSTEH